MHKDFSLQELATFHKIAETINKSTDLNCVLHEVLERVVGLSGLESGWIYLVNDDPPHFSLAASYGLPPALDANDKHAMLDGSCWCLDRYKAGILQTAENTIICKRLDDAVKHGLGCTNGITHHATIPLTAGSKMFGLMNLAAAEKTHFTEEELSMMQSVAYQIGTAVERTLLYQAQQKRADLFYRLGEATRELGKLSETEQIPAIVTEWVARSLNCPEAYLFMEDGNELVQMALFRDGTTIIGRKSPDWSALGSVDMAYRDGKTMRLNRSGIDDSGKALPYKPGALSSVAVPVLLREKPIGVIYACSPQINHFDNTDVEVLESLADHISLAYENAKIYQMQMDMQRWDERNRLARDLHDSVSQMLFSLQFTARGMDSLVDEESATLKNALRDIQQLTQNAQKEMRALICQLRPAELEEGLLTGLYRYGKRLGLTVLTHSDGISELSQSVEEVLYRIGQEALNNVRKHARTLGVQITLRREVGRVTLCIADHGRGFSKHSRKKLESLGLNSMRERAEALGGTFVMHSESGKGTTIQVSIPLSS